MKKYLALLFIIAFVFSLQACAPASAGEAIQPVQTVSLKILNLPYISFAPFWIAQDEGYFKAQGLDVQLVDLPDQSDGMPQLVNGQLDVWAGNLSSGFINSIARGSQIKLVSDKGYVDPQGCSSNAIVVRKGILPPDGQISPDLLRGKKFIIVRGSWLEYFAEKTLNPYGLKIDDFQITYSPPAAMFEGMNNGSVDLGTQNEPWVTRMLDNGHQVLGKPITQIMPNAETAVTLFGPRLLGNNSDVGKRFMIAYLQAVSKYNEGKTDSNVALIGKYTKLDPALIKRMCWPQLRSDGRLNMASIMDFQAWAVAKKLVDQPLTEQQIYDPSLVEYAAQHLPPK